MVRWSVVLLFSTNLRQPTLTDNATGMLSRVVPLRRKMHQEWLADGRKGPAVYPLKLVIMSATLRTEDFTGNRRWVWCDMMCQWRVCAVGLYTLG